MRGMHNDVTGDPGDERRHAGGTGAGGIVIGDICCGARLCSICSCSGGGTAGKRFYRSASGEPFHRRGHHAAFRGLHRTSWAPRAEFLRGMGGQWLALQRASNHQWQYAIGGDLIYGVDVKFPKCRIRYLYTYLCKWGHAYFFQQYIQLHSPRWDADHFCRTSRRREFGTLSSRCFRPSLADTSEFYRRRCLELPLQDRQLDR